MLQSSLCVNNESNRMVSFTLPEARLDLWFVWPDQANVEAEITGCQAILSEEERARGARFIFPRDQRVHLLTRALVRVVLGRYLGLAPYDLCFERNPFGKPNLIAAQREASHLAFNVSHTHGLIMLGVTCGRALGVDIESLRRNSLDTFTHEFMTRAELDAAGRLDAVARHQRSLETWTLKEAYIKARSIGLSLPLREMAFNLDNPSRTAFSTTGTLAGEAQRWDFRRFTIGSWHVGAVCLAARQGGLLPIRAASVTPLLLQVLPLTLNVCSEE